VFFGQQNVQNAKAKIPPKTTVPGIQMPRKVGFWSECECGGYVGDIWVIYDLVRN